MSTDQSTTTVHSTSYESFKEQYNLNFIRIDQLKRWVKINSINSAYGITSDEFLEITGQQYIV